MTDPVEHANCDLIIEKVRNMSLPVWQFWRAANVWLPSNLTAMCEFPNGKFALGEKPPAPPTLKCYLGGFAFSEPMKTAPKMGTKYWAAIPSQGALAYIWQGTSLDRQRLHSLCCHENEDSALDQLIAQNSALKQAVERVGQVDKPN